jgi:hypothetical protein
MKPDGPAVGPVKVESNVPPACFAAQATTFWILDFRFWILDFGTGCDCLWFQSANLKSKIARLIVYHQPL